MIEFLSWKINSFYFNMFKNIYILLTFLFGGFKYAFVQEKKGTVSNTI